MSLLRTAIRPAARLRLSAAPVTIAVRQLSFKPIYTSESTVKGARNGHLTTKSGSLDLNLNMPKEFGTAGGPGTNPEELFGGGYAACFGGALVVAAKELKLNLGSETTITSLVSIGPKPKGFQLAVELRVANSGLEGENFNKAVDLAHEICPFSHAVKGNIEVKTVKA
ncbi:hypothetical protein BGZ80_010103 [Entomortierella chlamydospora]|uniref:Organic hydroperoxide resistance protein n=1 Tax=Entomortierella chlamydospora TaxID=101097 RepID=A0A9P6MWD2_9FUNG|nr:hypothetical protein BGZ79_009894 [Entomortierella chlamydospora]KAG0015005.1 hypothetical protein BGZ80_010103 [Entomortierella chlamydospora]